MLSEALAGLTPTEDYVSPLGVTHKLEERAEQIRSKSHIIQVEREKMQMELSHKRARVELERAASTSARSYEVGEASRPGSGSRAPNLPLPEPEKRAVLFRTWMSLQGGQTHAGSISLRRLLLSPPSEGSGRNTGGMGVTGLESHQVAQGSWVCSRGYRASERRAPVSWLHHVAADLRTAGGGASP